MRLRSNLEIRSKEVWSTSRRQLLTGALLATTGLSGCLGGDSSAQEVEQDVASKATTTTTPEENRIITKFAASIDSGFMYAKLDTQHKEYQNASNIVYIDGSGKERKKDIRAVNGNTASWNIKQAHSERYTYVGGTQTVKLLASNGNVLEETSFDFGADLEVTNIVPFDKADVLPKHLQSDMAQNYLGENQVEAMPIITIKNNGNGPVTLEYLKTDAFDGAPFGFTDDQTGESIMSEEGNIMPGESHVFSLSAIDRDGSDLDVQCGTEASGDLTMYAASEETFTFQWTVAYGGTRQSESRGMSKKVYYCDDLTFSI